jgi:hypothetical protein
MPKVGVFISWSGNSRSLAEALHEWLPTALHSIEPWMSEHDIQKGTRFLEEVDRALDRCQAGIICITPENNKSMWVAFEAGALASRVASSKLVIPLISRMRSSDVTGPLGMFQGCQLTKSDMLRLLKNLNELGAEPDRIPERRLVATFEGVWPDLERQLPALEQGQLTIGEATSARKTDTQLLEEVLDVSRAIRILVEDRVRLTGTGGAGAAENPSPTVLDHGPMSSGSRLEGRENYAALADDLNRASEIWLSGVSLLTVVEQYYMMFYDSIEREKLTLRFLLLDPEDQILIETATRSLYGVTTAEELRHDISIVVRQIKQLLGAVHDKARVQLRYMANLPSTSIIMTNPMGENGKAIAEFYPYRASSSDRPHISLSKDSQLEKKWFYFYRSQFLAMWRDGRMETEN